MRIYLSALLLLLLGTTALAHDFDDDITGPIPLGRGIAYNVELQSTFSDDRTPLWLNANRHGLKNALTLEQRKQIIAEAAEQRYVEYEGGEARYTSGTVHELNANSTPIEREFYEYYRTPRGEFTPEGASPMTTTHPQPFALAEIAAVMPLMPEPTTMTSNVSSQCGPDSLADAGAAKRAPD